MEIIRIRDLNFSYSSGSAFRLYGVSLEVQEGEVMVLLGPNGCGKTTLLKCINALLKPQSGEVLLNGRNAYELGRSELACMVGFVPQAHNPPFPFTVEEAVLMGRASHLSIFQQPSETDYLRTEEALNLLGLTSMRDRPYTEISGGERQLVLIARAIAQEPKALLLDEPTAHLDFKNQVVVLKTVNRIAKGRGLGVVMSLHDPNQASLFSDKVALMLEGRVVTIGKPSEVVTAENINRLYGMNSKVLDYDGRRLVLPEL
jgi:iron complex transport system ATP-binding protein